MHNKFWAIKNTQKKSVSHRACYGARNEYMLVTLHFPFCSYFDCVRFWRKNLFGTSIDIHEQISNSCEVNHRRSRDCFPNIINVSGSHTVRWISIQRSQQMIFYSFNELHLCFINAVISRLETWVCWHRKKSMKILGNNSTRWPN